MYQYIKFKVVIYPILKDIKENLSFFSPLDWLYFFISLNTV